MRNKNRLVRRKRGFTLVELLMAVTAASLFTGLTIANYVTNQQKQTMKAANRELRSTVEYARQRAVTSELPDGCASYSDFLGYGFRATAGATNIEINYYCPTRTVVRNILLTKYKQMNINNTSTVSFYFKKRTGELNTTATQTIRLKHAGLNKCSSLSVNQFGIISFDDDIACL